MRPARSGGRGRRAFLCVIAAIAMKPLLGWTLASSPPAGDAVWPPSVLAPVPSVGGTGDRWAGWAERDPLGLLAAARDKCRREIRDYRCVLRKQEQLGGELSKLQRIELRYRAQPHSVYLRWIENAGEARRASYVRGRDVDEEGRELATVEPAGCILRLFIEKLRTPVHGERARAASRQSLDQVGYEGTFGGVEAVNALAQARGDLVLRFSGMGLVDGRPTLVLTRTLPYSGDGGAYPNGRLELHLDAEWLLPVGVYAYSDGAGRVLLGSYEMTQVEVNVGLDDAAFEL